MFLASAYLAGILSSAVELRHLRYFVAVAEMENVSRAATQRLHVAQPSLSRQIRDLEAELGVQLLERTAKSVRLTEPGRAFLEEARAILKHTDEALLKARAIGGKGQTELHIGYSPTPTTRILPEILRAYREVMPDVHVNLHDWSKRENIAGVRDGRLQLALVVRPPKAAELRGLRFQPLTYDRVCLAVSPQHPFAKRRSVPLADAVTERFIALTREDYPDYADFLAVVFAPTKKKPYVIEEHDSMSGIISSVEAGNGVALGTDVFSHTFGHRVRLVHLTPEPEPFAIGIAAPKGKLPSAAEKFWQCASEACGTIR